MTASDEVLEHSLADIHPPAAAVKRPLVQARVCGTFGCAARLSRYNDSSTCWLHGPGSDPMRRLK